MSVSIDEVDCDLRVLSEGGSFEGPIIVCADDGRVEVAPSGHCCLLIPEPLGGHLRNVGRGHVRDAGGDLSSTHKAVQIGQLLGISQRDVSWLVELQKVVEVFVPSAENLGLVDLGNLCFTFCA